MRADLANIRQGDLVFDVGAFKGVKTSEYLSCGASVVAFEMNPVLCNNLRKRFGDRIQIVTAAVSDKDGEVQWYKCRKTPSISTCRKEWMKGRFRNSQWTPPLATPSVTLDWAIEKFGIPKFIKIDVEGYEEYVLRGLHTKVPILSIEFACDLMKLTNKALKQLRRLGYTSFGIALGKTGQVHEWTNERMLKKNLSRLATLDWGDIYARDA